MDMKNHPILGLRDPWQWVQPRTTDEILNRLLECRQFHVHDRERENMCSVAIGEITRLSGLVESLRRAHRASCPGCELCTPGSDYMRNRPRPELDMDGAGRPLRPGT